MNFEGHFRNHEQLPWFAGVRYSHKLSHDRSPKISATTLAATAQDFGNDFLPGSSR